MIETVMMLPAIFVGVMEGAIEFKLVEISRVLVYQLNSICPVHRSERALEEDERP